MTPRKSQWIFWVVGLAVLCLLMATPLVQASRSPMELGCPSPIGGSPTDNFQSGPPQGGPGGTGGGDGGDPDDYSNLLRAPQDPVLEPVQQVRVTETRTLRSVLWSDPMFHAVLVWLGIER